MELTGDRQEYIHLCVSFGLGLDYLKGRRKQEAYEYIAELILSCPLTLFAVAIQYIQATQVQPVMFAKFITVAQWRLN